MITAAQLIDEALTWINTPFQANQSCKGAGADCIGVIAGIARNCGISIQYRNDYPMRPDGSLRRELNAQMTQINFGIQDADVLMMTFEGEPHHVGMYVGNGQLLHSYMQVRKCIAQPFTKYWRDRVIGVYRFRELINV